MPEPLPIWLKPRPQQSVPGATLTTVLLAVVVVAALYFGREVLVPIALAVLLSFVLAPFVSFLQGWYVPRIVAVLGVTLLALVIVLGLAALMVAQVNQLAGELPRYETTLREKIQSLRGVMAGTGTLERASEVLQGLRKEIERSENAPPSRMPGGEQPPPTRPIPVEVRQPDPGALQTLVALITPLIFPLTTTGVVFIFVVFILVQRQDLRNRLVRLAGAQDLQRTTAALDDAGTRLSRLFLTQLALNAAFGMVIGAGLWIIGVPSAPLWGMLAMILRFVPYVGALISAVFPVLLAAAVDPGWTMVLWKAVLFVVVEPLVGHVIEPMVYSHSSGLSPVAVIAAATFWTPVELIYQRMLARDPVEATEQARLFLRQKPLIAYYDEILLEGLKLAQADAERDRLDEERTRRIRDAVAEIVDDLGAHEDEPEREADAAAAPQSPLAQLEKAAAAPDAQPLPERWRTGKPVLCIPGVGLLDEAVAMMIAQLVERRGIGARAEQADALSMSRIFSLDTKGVELICVCYVEIVSAAQVRYAVRRIHRMAPDVLVLVALFGDGLEGEDVIPSTDVVRGSRQATVDRVVAIANGANVPDMSPTLTAKTPSLAQTLIARADEVIE